MSADVRAIRKRWTEPFLGCGPLFTHAEMGCVLAALDRLLAERDQAVARAERVAHDAAATIAGAARERDAAVARCEDLEAALLLFLETGAQPGKGRAG